MEIPAGVIILFLVIFVVLFPFFWLDRHHISCNSVCLGLFGVVAIVVIVVAAAMSHDSKQ